ncbi:MAG: DUF4880 domain-containing protein [Alphaproteobacteria bacterium]|nr:DUF4880 domain-containing protein [Alphaproteobacteria bacterium]
MSNRNNNPHAPNTAEEWYVRNQGDDLSDDDCVEFLKWIEQAPENESDYARLEAVSSLMESVASDSTINPHAQNPQYSRRPARRAQNWVLAAASFAAIVVAVGMFWSNPFGAKTYQTAIGEQQVIALSDGSLVRLNTNTIVKVKYDAKRRYITLKKGEAYFDVQEDQLNRAFEVGVGKSSVRAIGTEFNIQYTDKITIINVLEGVVEVLKSGAISPAQDKSSELPEGYRLTVDSTGSASERETANTVRINAWTRGRLEFDAEVLSVVVREFNRYSKTKLILADEQLNDILISGSFTIGRSAGFARGLKESFPITVTTEPDRLVLHLNIEENN